MNTVIRIFPKSDVFIFAFRRNSILKLMMNENHNIKTGGGRIRSGCRSIIVVKKATFAVS